MVDPQLILNKLWTLLVEYAPKVLLAIITLILGFWLIKQLKKLMLRVMKKRKVDKTLQPFLTKLVTVSLKVLLLVSIAGMVGIEVTSFIAVLGAAGLAIGLALQGSLANFAGGVLILLLKPYKVGDFIVAQGEAGTVNEIQIFHTILKTPDNKTIVIPNGPMANGNITNITEEPKRKVEWTFGIGYDDDLKKAKKLIEKILTKDKRVLQEEGMQIVLGALADSSVNIIVRVWVLKEDYWNMFFDLNERVKETFDKNGISIPYPQRDVHLHKK